MFGIIMNSRDDFHRLLLHQGHPTAVARRTNLFDLQVKAQRIPSMLLGWLPFNEYLSIQVHMLPWWGREQGGKPSTEDMLFGKRLSPAKDTLSRHMLYYPSIQLRQVYAYPSNLLISAIEWVHSKLYNRMDTLSNRKCLVISSTMKSLCLDNDKR